MARSEQDQEIEKTVLAILKELEAALKKGWMLPSQQNHIIKGNPESETINGMKWVRQHIRSGLAYPSIQDIEEHIFGSQVSGMGIDDVILEVSKNLPSRTWYKDNLYRQVSDLICGSWGLKEPNREGPLPRNYHLPVSHPDKVDEYGYSYYMNTDEDGYPVADFDKNDLSEKGEIARKQYGISGRLTDSIGERVIRYPRPVITDINRFLVEKRRAAAAAIKEKMAASDTTQIGVIEDAQLHKLWNDRHDEEYAKQKMVLERTKKQMKKLLETDEVTQEDYDAVNVKKQLKFWDDEKKQQLSRMKDDPDELRRVKGGLMNWKKEKRKAEMNK